MIAIPRDVARAFRVIAKKCLAGRPRGPAPVVVCRVRAGRRSLGMRTESAGLLHTAPIDLKDETLVVPMDVFAAIEGPEPEVVELFVNRKLHGTAKWLDRGAPQSQAFVALLPGQHHTIPDLPEAMAPVPGEFLTALHECGKIAAREAGRFVLNHLQVRGKAGQVIATDSKRALVWGGFGFPFSGDVLVPAIPAFGCREIAAEESVQVGHTETDLVVACGPWSIHLPVNTIGKYPDVMAIVPKPGVGTTVRFDEAAVEELLRALPSLPGAKEEERPVTLDLDQELVVRARAETTDLVREVSLRVDVAGPGKCVAVDRQVLVRGLTLGCRTIRIHPVTHTLSFEAPNRMFLTAALDPALVVPRPDSSTRSPVAERTERRPIAEPTTERSTTVKAHEANGLAPNGRHEPPPTEESLDPLAEAEALRLAIAEVGTRVGRLIAALRSTRKEKKVLANVWAGLKQLNLGGGAS